MLVPPLSLRRPTLRRPTLRRPGTLLALCWLLGLGFATLASAQAAAQGTSAQEPATPPPPLAFEGSTTVTWVMVPLVVQSSDLERPLRRQDLVLTVDGAELHFEDFQAAVEEPSTLLLFQDLSGSMANGGKLAASQRAARCFVAQARPQDRMSVVTFAAGKTLIETPATSEMEVISELIDGWQGYGSTALHDAVSWIPDLRLSTASRMAAVLITDGVDNASTLTAETARQLVRQAEIPVYVLALRGSRLMADEPLTEAAILPSTSGVADGEPSFSPYRSVLQQLAAATGGLYFDIFLRHDIDSACRRIANDQRNRYTLGFPLSQHGKETYHPLRITVPGHRFTVRHRGGYSGRRPAASTSPP